MLLRESADSKPSESASFDSKNNFDIFEGYGANQDYEEEEIIINIEGTMRLFSKDEYNEHTSKLKYVNLVDEEDDDWDDYWDEDDDNDGEE